jgi:multidrug efflux pump subunit AcrA (membrane-fusion protein)
VTPRRRAIAWAVLAVAIVVGGLAIVALRRGSPDGVPPAADAGAAPAVALVRAAFERYTTRVSAQGRVGAPSGGETKLAFADTGIVSRVDVRVGEPVRAGEPLAELDAGGFALDAAQARSDAAAAAAGYGGGSVPLDAAASARARLAAVRDKLRALENGTAGAQSDREAALAAVRQSEAKLVSDRSALDRETTLYAGGVVARKDVEGARAALAFDRADADANRAKARSAGAGIGAALLQARADLAQAQSDARAARAQITVAGAQSASAQARYEAARRLVALATLSAPVDGVVTAILKHPGEAVDPTAPALVLAPAASDEVTLTVAGDDARHVHAGDLVRITVTSRHIVGRGRVRAVVPGVDPATQATTLVVSGSPPGATPGDAVEATIDVGERRGIVIPTSAIVEDPQSGRSIVFVRERTHDGSEKFVSREITVAIGDDRNSLVASGLREGDRVAAQGAFDLLAPSGGG